MKKNNKYIRYDQALTDNEILTYSQAINEFKNGRIDFTSLKNIFLNYGITIEPVLEDFSRTMMTVNEANIIKKRISEQNYIYSDVDYFILNGHEFANVVFRLDYKAIEILANYGIPEYQETLISILKTQLKLSYDMNEDFAIERAKWKRRISELEASLGNSKDFEGKKTK